MRRWRASPNRANSGPLRGLALWKPLEPSRSSSKSGGATQRRRAASLQAVRRRRRRLGAHPPPRSAFGGEGWKSKHFRSSAGPRGRGRAGPRPRGQAPPFGASGRLESKGRGLLGRRRALGLQAARAPSKPVNRRQGRGLEALPERGQCEGSVSRFQGYGEVVEGALRAMRSFASILFSKPVMEPCFFLKMISEVHFDKLSHNPDGSPPARARSPNWVFPLVCIV